MKATTDWCADFGEMQMRWWTCAGLLALSMAVCSACDDSNGGSEPVVDSAGGTGGPGGFAGFGGASDAGDDLGGGAGGMPAIDRGLDASPPVDRGPRPDMAQPDVGALDLGVGECSLQSPCPGNQICNGGTCFEAPMCVETIDCLGDRYCQDGACEDSCTRDIECPGARACVQARCVESADCFVPADCNAGRTCSAGACVDRCVDDAPCAGTRVCEVASGLCVEGPGCAEAADCLDGRICVDGACLNGCQADGDCPGTRGCDVPTGRCPEPQQCFAVEDCDAGRECVANSCTGRCDADHPCPIGSACGADGQCALACDGPGICPAEQFCQAQRCVRQACDDGTPCPAGLRCVDDVCTDQPECINDPDCPGARVCRAGRCVAGEGCLDDPDCDDGRICQAGQCVAGCGADAPCSGAQQCVDGRCAEVNPCLGDVDCFDGRFCLAGACGPLCMGDAQCPGNRRCFDGRCPEPDNCFSPDDCDPGRICSNFECVRGCMGPEDCPIDTACVANQCQPVAGCGEDEDCGRAEICEGERCVAAECVEQVECGDGVCADRRCIGAAPVACADDAACGRLSCAPLGACVPPDQCGAPADCPPAAPLCDDDRCYRCVVDGDCAPAEACAEGRCALVEPCAANPDCPGDRSCANGQCVPALGCAPNALNGATLAARLYQGLRWCDGTVDRYLFDLPPNQGLRIVIRHADGDLALRVFDAAVVGLPIGASDEPYGVERVEVAASQVERQLRIDVDGRAGAAANYSLHIQRLLANTCVVDDFEGARNNDVQARATPLPPGGAGHTICGGESDWFAVDLPRGVRVNAQASADDLNLRFIGPGDQELAVGQDDAMGTLSLQADTVQPGTHHLEVSGSDDGVAATNQLRVTLAASPDAAAQACREPPALPPNGQLMLPAGVAITRLPTTCSLGAPATTHVARFVLARQGRVTLQLEGEQLGSAIALRRACAVSDDAHCAVGDAMGLGGGPVIEDAELDAGVWFVVVEAGTTEALRLRLLVQ